MSPLSPHLPSYSPVSKGKPTTRLNTPAAVPARKSSVGSSLSVEWVQPGDKLRSLYGCEVVAYHFRCLARQDQTSSDDGVDPLSVLCTYVSVVFDEHPPRRSSHRRQCTWWLWFSAGHGTVGTGRADRQLDDSLIRRRPLFKRRDEPLTQPSTLASRSTSNARTTSIIQCATRYSRGSGSTHNHPRLLTSSVGCYLRDDDLAGYTVIITKRAQPDSLRQCYPRVDRVLVNLLLWSFAW